MRASLVVCLWLLGCAAGSAEAPRPDGADAQQRLQRVRTEHDAIAKQLAEVPPERLETCRSSAGDCLLQVAENRGRLVSGFALNPCDDAATPEAKSSCVTKQLEGGGHTRELSDYYALESWCFKQLTACTVNKAEEARVAALDARFVERKRSLEKSPEGHAARGGLQLVRARIEYLRATLPPAAEICKPDASFEACKSRSDAEQASFEETLKGESFDAKAATGAFVAALQSEASCSQPELDCLSSALTSYGVYPETRKWVDRNLALLGDRQKLLGQVSDEAGQHCLSSAQKQHQPEIVSAYVAYVRDPVLFFRQQLDKSFMALHEDEVTCLGAGRKSAPAVQAVATKR